jgi:hypothetical protein
MSSDQIYPFYDYNKYNSIIHENFKYVEDTTNQLNKSISFLYGKNIMVNSKIVMLLDEIKSKTKQIGRNHSEIMGYKFYWTSKKRIMSDNKHVPVNSKEYNKKKAIDLYHYYLDFNKMKQFGCDFEIDDNWEIKSGISKRCRSIKYDNSQIKKHFNYLQSELYGKNGVPVECLAAEKIAEGVSKRGRKPKVTQIPITDSLKIVKPFVIQQCKESLDFDKLMAMIDNPELIDSINWSNVDWSTFAEFSRNEC